MIEQTASDSFVVCSLKYELERLRRAGLARYFKLHQCGLGGSSVWQWSQRVQIPAGAQVWLAGLAGGLHHNLQVGQAYAINSIVIDPTAQGTTDLRPPLQALAPTAKLTSVGQPLTTPQQKAATYATTGADLVDMEAGDFGKIAEVRGWRWGVIKGISDTSDQGLPKIVTAMTNQEGHHRLWPMAWGLARGPHHLPALMALGQNARRGLASVAACLLAMAQNQASSV